MFVSKYWNYNRSLGTHHYSLGNQLLGLLSDKQHLLLLKWLIFILYKSVSRHFKKKNCPSECKKFTSNSNQGSIVKMKTEIYCWPVSKLAHNFLNQQIFPPLSGNILSDLLPITFFLLPWTANMSFLSFSCWWPSGRWLNYPIFGRNKLFYVSSAMDFVDSLALGSFSGYYRF